MVCILMKLVYAMIIFGYVCNDHPNMDNQCTQVYIPGVISRADCSVKFYSYLHRYKEQIAKKGLSLTHKEVYCLSSDPDVDTVHKF